METDPLTSRLLSLLNDRAFAKYVERPGPLGQSAAGNGSVRFFGCRKTTLLNQILRNRKGLRVAVIVNDISEISIDGPTFRSGGARLSRTDEQLVEMSNGCICCTLREDLIEDVTRMAAERRFDYLMIESTGIGKPMPVAATFSFRDENANGLSDVARLGTMVTVVDGGICLKSV